MRRGSVAKERFVPTVRRVLDPDLYGFTLFERVYLVFVGVVFRQSEREELQTVLDARQARSSAIVPLFPRRRALERRHGYFRVLGLFFFAGGRGKKVSVASLMPVSYTHLRAHEK